MRDLLLQNDVEIAYLGIPNNNITIKLILLYKFYSTDKPYLTKSSRKAALIIAECFQNVIRHSEEKKDQPDSSRRDFFQMKITENGTSVGSKNLISPEDISALENKIDTINSLDKDALKALWKKTIKEGELSAKGGAGLGIIEMARKTDFPIQKKFVAKKNELSDFFISLNLRKEGLEANDVSTVDDLDLDYRKFIDEKVLVYYKGEFTADINVILIEMLWTNFSASEHVNDAFVEKLKEVAEITENAAIHGAEYEGSKSGLFYVFETEGQKIVSCVNLIKNENKELFENRLAANNKSNYSFKALDDTYSIFSIDVLF